MLDLISHAFIHRALIGGVLIALSCGAIGPPLVLRRLSLLSDGLAHVAFTGVAIGLLLNIHPFYAVIIATLLGSYFVHRLIQGSIAGDAAIAILLAVGVGSGILIISLRRGFTANLYSYLIGSIFTMRNADIILAAIILAAIILYYILFHRQILMLCFNRQLAALFQRRYAIAETLYAMLVACVITVTIRAVGILLVSAMIAIPTLIALTFARSFRQTIIFATLTATISLLLGLLIAIALNIPPSAATVLLLASLFLLSSAIKKLRARRIL